MPLRLFLLLVACSVSLPQQPFIVSGIFLTHPDRLNSVYQDPNQIQQPRSLLARSLEPLLGAMSVMPSSSYFPSGMGGSTFHPYNAFARFTSTGGAPNAGLFSNHWNVLPFSVGRYCDQQIISEPEYQQCRADAAVNWRAAEHNLDGHASIDAMRSCCFFWSILSCMEDSVRRRCGEQSTLDYFRQRRTDLRLNLESSYGVCSNYPQYAFRCYLQNWILILAFMILSVFILVVIISIVWILVVRKRRKDVDDSPSERANASRGRTFANPFRSQQTRVMSSPSRPSRLPDLERPPPSPQHTYATARQISL